MTPQALKIAESIETPNSPHDESDARPILFRIVARDVARRAEAIQRELEAAFEPCTPVQTAAVAELALARTRQYDLEAAHDALIAESVARAAESANRFARDRFVKDRDAWLADPALNLPILASTLKGTEFLAQIWADFAAMLAAGTPGPTDEQKRLAIAALGSPWQVDKARGEGLWLLSRLIRIAKEPGFEAAHWAKQSGSPDSTAERARWIASLAPDPATARAELAERAAAEHARWSQVAEFCRQHERLQRTEAASAALAAEAVDTTLEKRLRQNARELSAARNRADRLERRLDLLMKPRRTSRPKPSQAESADPPAKPAPAAPSPEPARAPKPPVSENDSTESRIGNDRPAALLSVSGIAPVAEPEPENRTSVSTAEDPPCGAEADVISQEIGEVEVRESISRDSGRSATLTDDEDPEAMARTLAYLKTRLKQFRFLNWRDPKAIAQGDVDILTRIRKLPRSAERDKLIRHAFGSEKTYERAWRGYRSWCDRQAPAGVLMPPAT